MFTRLIRTGITSWQLPTLLAEVAEVSEVRHIILLTPVCGRRAGDGHAGPQPVGRLELAGAGDVAGDGGLHRR
jgi:hypothetical protein